MGNFRPKPDKNTEQMVFGMRPVIEAVNAGKEVENLLIQNNLQGENCSELMRILKHKGQRFQRVPIEKLNRLTRGNHQGVVCFISPISYTNLEDILPFVYEKGKDPLIVLLDGITDVRNFGAIARTAECAGVDGLVIPEKGGARVTADAIKTSAGALSKMPVCKTKSIESSIRLLQDSGVQVVACSEKGEKVLYDIEFNKPTALIIGAEDTGVSGSCLNLADEVVRIPILCEIESLNVSVASGVVIYEVLRQRS